VAQEQLDRGLVPGRQPIAHAVHFGVVPGHLVERRAGPLGVLALQTSDLLEAGALPTPYVRDVGVVALPRHIPLLVPLAHSSEGARQRTRAGWLGELPCGCHDRLREITQVQRD
jgi:hypothetical protein